MGGGESDISFELCFWGSREVLGHTSHVCSASLPAASPSVRVLLAGERADWLLFDLTARTCYMVYYTSSNVLVYISI